MDTPTLSLEARRTFSRAHMDFRVRAPPEPPSPYSRNPSVSTMATSNDERYPSSSQQPHYYQPQLMRPSTAGSSAEGGSGAQHVRYADEDRSPVKPKVEEAAFRMGGGRSGRRTAPGTSTGTGLGLSLWKSKKDKRNGKKKSKATLDSSSDNDDSMFEPEKKPVEVVYRGQAGGSRSGRGLSIPLPVRTDKSKSKGKGIYRTSGSDDGSETGSVLSIGLGVPAEQWERERGVAPSTNRPFNPSTLQAIKSLPVRSPPPLDTASQFGSSSMMSGSGSGLSTWSEEEEEGNGDMRNDSRGNNRESPDRASDETFRRRHPPPHYSTIHSPSSADPRFYSGATKRGRTRPLPLRPESPVSPPFSSYPSSPSLSPPSANSRGWPTPPRPAYAHSISSGSSSSMPPTPPMHPLDLYTQRGRSKSPGAAQGLGLTMHSPTMIPWDAPGLGNRSEGSIHTPTGGIEIPRNNNNGDDPGVITGVVSGVDAAGRPYQYTYQYQSASGAPPNPGEMIAALGPPQPYYAQQGQRPSSPTTSVRYGNMYPHVNVQTQEGGHPHMYTHHSQPGSPYPSSSPANSPPSHFFPPPPPPPTQSSPRPPQRSPDRKSQQRPTKRLVISGIGAPGADDLHFDFERALDEMHLVGSGDDKSDGGRNDGNDSDVDPAITKREEKPRGSQQQKLGNTGSLRDQSAKEKEREEAVIQWCRGFGDVLEVRRRGQGCLMIEFLMEGVVDSICRVQQVYIKGAGKVEVGWC